MGAFDLGRFLWPDVGQGRLPKSPTPVDRSTALGARVIGGCVPGVVSLRDGGRANVKEFAAGLFGVGSDGGSGNYSTASAAQQLAGRSTGAAASNRDFTLVFIGNLTSVNSIWFYDGQSDGAGGSWFVNTNASGQLGAWFGGTINLPAVTLATGPCVLIIHGGTYGGGASKVWYNGTEYTGSGATDSWGTSPAFATFFGSSAYPTVNTFAGVGNLAVVLRGNVTSAEAQAIRDNPAAIFDTPQSLMWMPPSSGSGITLTADTSTHAHSVDSPVLVAQSTLVVADASHAHAADSLTLATQSTLVVADASHAHAADNLTLSTGLVVDLTIQDSTHAHTSDTPALAAQSFLQILDASHGHTADSLALTTLLVLLIADSSHGHAADNLTLAGSSAADLVIQDSTHAHSVDSPVLVTQSTLVVADASHGHSADSLNLAAQSFLAIADTSHGHAADNLTLSPVLVVDLTIQDSTHAHTSDTAFLTTILPTSKPGYIADDTYRSFSSDDPLRVFATDDLAGGMHMAHRFPSIEVEEKVPLTFRFGAELVDQGATLTSISSLAVAVRNGVADASPSSLVTISSISGTNVVAAVDGRTAGADFELRVTCATSNPYLVLTRVGYVSVNG